MTTLPFHNVQDYNPQNPSHRTELKNFVEKNIFRRWFKGPYLTLTEAMPLFEFWVGWFRAAKLDDFIPLADFEAVVMDALRDNLEADTAFKNSIQQHFKLA